MKTESRILTSRDYNKALEEIESFMDRPGELSESEMAHYRSLVDQVEAYESTHFPISAPDPASS